MKKKLKLSRETITRLTDRNLVAVAGGNFTEGCTTINGSYVHQTQVYACNASLDCTTNGPRGDHDK